MTSARAPVTFLVYDAFTGDGVARTTANLANQLSATRQVRMVSLYRTQHRPRFDFRGSGLGHTLRLGSWTVLFVIVNQIAYTVVVRIASSGLTLPLRIRSR